MGKLDVRIAGTMNGGPPKVLPFQVGANATFVAGEWVRLCTNDKVSEIGSAGATGCIGVALEDAKYEAGHPLAGTVKTGYVPVALLDSNTIFSAKVLTGTFVAGEAFKQFDVAIVSTVHGVNPDATTYKTVIVHRADPSDSTRVLVVGNVNDANASNLGSSALGNVTNRAAE